MRTIFWKQDEIDFLRNNPDMPTNLIAQHINRSPSSIREKRSQLGITRTPTPVGTRFGKLTITDLYDKQSNGQKHKWSKCLCDCGREHHAQLSELKRGNIISCGCAHNDMLSDDVKVGDRFFRLVILEKYSKYEHSQNKTYVLCQCDCGNKTHQKLSSLKGGRIKSCGCLKAEKAAERCGKLSFKNGRSNHHYRLYRIWNGMRSRCKYSSMKQFKDYGGRGIRVCDEWDNFETFESWALSHGYAEGLSIDRIDPDGNYEPSNCRWATAKEQAQNTRAARRIDRVHITAFGETKSIRDWIKDERCVVKGVNALSYRLGSGWPPEIAITKPSERENTI